MTRIESVITNNVISKQIRMPPQVSLQKGLKVNIRFLMTRDVHYISIHSGKPREILHLVILTTQSPLDIFWPFYLNIFPSFKYSLHGGKMTGDRLLAGVEFRWEQFNRIAGDVEWIPLDRWLYVYAAMRVYQQMLIALLMYLCWRLCRDNKMRKAEGMSFRVLFAAAPALLYDAMWTVLTLFAPPGDILNFMADIVWMGYMLIVIALLLFIHVRKYEDVTPSAHFKENKGHKFV